MNTDMRCFMPLVLTSPTEVLPELFTFPFCYQAHAVTIQAAEQLQALLEKTAEINTKVGLCNDTSSKGAVGKMFGVLVVKKQSGEVGYLSAYSGQAIWQDCAIPFVDNICNVPVNDQAYIKISERINNLNSEIARLSCEPSFIALQQRLVEQESTYQQQLSALQHDMVQQKKQRKIARQQALAELSPQAYQQLEKNLAGQSIALKKQLKHFKTSGQQALNSLQIKLASIEQEISALKKLRRTLSKNLQKKLFAQYRFLNANNQQKNLNEIFAEIPEHMPPAGAGDCAAPKLLQYAFEHDLQPIAMGEFWWGQPPRSAIRKHKHFYPSCYSKCQPILGHMLQGLHVEANPLLENPAQGKALPIVYQDDDILIVNKPAEFLSVPGKHIEDSVYTRIKALLPKATGPLIVHRLDMSTSGLLVLALNKRAHKALQQQFIHRQVEKRYSALVVGEVSQQEQIIELPLRLDLDDKPRQLVCFQYGKSALTYCKKIRKQGEYTLLHLFPKTGRTHQLRVHCAHHLGLNTPIVGDDHYGIKANRLHLHAEYLAFSHPITKKTVSFTVKADFDKQTV